MNTIKFKDIVMTIQVLQSLPEEHALFVDERGEWYHGQIDPDMTVDEFCTYFNTYLRNKYAWCIHWEWVIPLELTDGSGDLFPLGNPLDLEPEYPSYVAAEHGNFDPHEYFYLPKTLTQWVDEVTTVRLMQNERIKFNYLNEFTPDDDITIDELKVFRTWLAQILLANTPLIEEWPDSKKLVNMLTYYVQGMKDTTTDNLNDFAVYMTTGILVSGVGVQNVMNMARIGLSAGCGCNSAQGVGNIGLTGGCDPLQMYRNAIYNYMVQTFSNINYWMEQVEICGEMRKYIRGILQAGLPLGSKVIDPYADCGCNTFGSQDRYVKMLEALIQALTYIIEGQVAGNRNYITTAFSNWATYLYEYMYWA